MISEIIKQTVFMPDGDFIINSYYEERNILNKLIPFNIEDYHSICESGARERNLTCSVCRIRRK